jgi:hypothetical protein
MKLMLLNITIDDDNHDDADGADVDGDEHTYVDDN